MNPQAAPVEKSPRHTSAAHFAEQLRALRSDVGRPSFRAMAGRSGKISHTTLHEAATGTRFPSWETTREFVRACGADEALWRQRWEDAQRASSAALSTGGFDQPSDHIQPAPVAASPGGDTAISDAVPEFAATPVAETAGSQVSRQALPGQWRWIVVGVTAVAVAVVMVLTGTRANTAAAPTATSSVSPPTTAADPSAGLVPGDASRFVADVTVPDGTQVRVNSHFVKVWAIANTGTVGWHHRFLARMNPLSQEELCQTPDRVPIGDTLPGDQAKISVPVDTGNRPGRCWVGWKMVDEHGRTYFPSRRPVYFLVDVTH